MRKLFTLTWAFALMGLLAVGGGTAVLPEMRRMTVHDFGWLTDVQFREIYGLGQVAPGPNMLMVMIIGYRVAGAAGALVVMIAFFLPDCILTLFANRVWLRYEGSEWRNIIQHAMAPVAIGLMLSGTYTVAKLSLMHPQGWVVAAAAFAVLSWRKINPLLVITIGGAIYLAFALA